MHGTLANLRHERFAQALARGKTTTEAYVLAGYEAYVLAGYKANDGNASRMKGNERISARVKEIVGRAAERAGVSLERTLRELAAIAFSDISKAVTWGPSVQVREEYEDGQRVKVIVSAVLLVPSDKLDENTAAAISAVSQGPAGAVRIKMHNKLPALVALGKYLGMFDQRPQNSNVIYAISDEPMSAEEWKKQYVKEG
jgi:phage terminase small subunit